MQSCPGGCCRHPPGFHRRFRFRRIFSDRQRLVTGGDIVQVQGDIFQRIADGVAAVFDIDVIHLQLRVLRGDAFRHAVAGVGAGAVVTHKGLQGAVAAHADADRVVRPGFGGGDGQTILTITDVNNTGGHAGVSFVNRIANAGQRGVCRADIDGHRIFTVTGGKGDLAVSRGNGRFGIRLRVLVVRVCACASCDTLMVYLPAIALPVVVALNAVELLDVLVAVNRSALFSAVLAV